MITPPNIDTRIASASGPEQLKLIKQLRNAIVGHNHEKLIHASDSSIPVLLQILSNPSAPSQNRAQAAIVITSFTTSINPPPHQIVPTLLSLVSPSLPSEILSPLLQALTAALLLTPSPSLLTSCASTLLPDLAQIINQSSSVSTIDNACLLIPHLSTSSSFDSLLQPLVSKIIAFANAPAINLLAKPLESALFALATILAQNHIPLLNNQFLLLLLTLARSPFPGIAVASIASLTKIQYYTQDPIKKKSLAQPLLPALLPYIISSPSSSPDIRVFRTLAVLCRDNKNIAALALEAGVINRLASIVKSADYTNWSDAPLLAEALLGLAAIALHSNSLRENVVATGILPSILQFMLAKPENPISLQALDLRKVKISACHLLRALARSIALLRTSLTTVDILDGIHELLAADPNTVLDAYDRLYGPGFADRQQTLEAELTVKTAVMAAVCNLIPEFSALRTPMVQRGFLPLIVHHARSSYSPLRLNALWALKHAIFGLPPAQKLSVLRELSPEYIMQLCDDPEPQIQEQALSFLRNFVYAKNIALANLLLTEIGPSVFLHMLEQKLVADTLLSQQALIAVSAVYILVHLATLSPKHRNMIVQRDSLLQKLLPLTKNAVPELRVACFWVVINVVYEQHSSPRSDPTEEEEQEQEQEQDDPSSRAKKLIAVGFLDAIKPSLSDPSLDVAQRAKEATRQLLKYAEN